MKTSSQNQIRLFTLTALAACSLIGTVSAQQGEHEQALRELNIMRNIFAAALEQDNGRSRMRFSEPDSLYLAGQGMVFTFNLAGGLNPFLFSGIQQLGSVDAVGGSANFGGRDFDYDFDAHSNRLTGNLGGAEDSPYQEQLRELSAALRDKQEEMRDLQRDLRRLERAQEEDERGDESTDKDTEIASVENAMKTLGESMQVQADSYGQLMREYQVERNAAFEAQRQEQTTVIFDTLCEYGNTLRSLENGEHVNLVLRNFNAGQPQVFVLDYDSIATCTSPQSLRENALGYSL